MFIFDSSASHPDDSAEFFIGENLSIYQGDWLRNQSEALGQTRAQILEAILKEWLLDHRHEDLLDTETGGIDRRGMSGLSVR